MREVTLVFKLEEDVTPSLFARRVLEACATYGALRSGEGIEVLEGFIVRMDGEPQLERLLGNTIKLA